MATEYGAYGDQPWRDAQPQYPGQPRQGDGPPEYEAPPPAPQPRRRPAGSTAVAGIALALGLLGLVVCVTAAVTSLRAGIVMAAFAILEVAGVAVIELRGEIGRASCRERVW